MAAPTMQEIRVGIESNLKAVYLPDWQVSAYMLGDPTPPAMHIIPAEVKYDAAMHRGMDDIRMTIQAYTGIVSDRGAQERLDQLLNPTGATSMKAAVEADTTLGGKVDDLRVVIATGYQVYALNGQAGLVVGCEWTVHIVALGA